MSRLTDFKKLSHPQKLPTRMCLAFAILALSLAVCSIRLQAEQETADFFQNSLHESRLGTFHPSDFVVATDHGENRIQFLLSLKYEFIPLEGLEWQIGPYHLGGLNFVYDGLYDFYLWTRYSQPIVSRLQNPGLLFSLEAKHEEAVGHMQRLDLGWFHESNGQVVDTIAEYNALYAQEGLRARDSVSRGWDYWYASPKFTFDPKNEAGLDEGGETSNIRERFVFDPSLRMYTGAQGIVIPAEQDIFWAPQDPPKTIYDYDGIRGLFIAEWIFPWRAFNYVGIGSEFRTGYNTGYLGRNWSKKFTLTFKTWNIPWYVYYENGYGPYISDYSTWSQGYGAGIRMW
jgi:outer membrane phospholipase A